MYLTISGGVRKPHGWEIFLPNHEKMKKGLKKENVCSIFKGNNFYLWTSTFLLQSTIPFFIFFRTINHPKQKIQKEAEESCFYQLSLYNKKEDHTISMKKNESFV